MSKLILSNNDLLKEFDKHIRGHTEAKKILINLIRRSQRRYQKRWLDSTAYEELTEPGRCLLIGESGTGKTAMVNAITTLCDVPTIAFDATQLAPGEGASSKLGLNGIKEEIYNHAANLVKNKEPGCHSVEGTVDQTIVIIDEIDKLSYGYESSGNWNSHIQANLLTLLDHSDDIFQGVTYIFMGAFARLDRDKKVSKSMGFSPSTNTKIDQRGLIDDAIIKGGMISEFVGRLNYIIELDKLSKEDYKSIFVDFLMKDKLKDLEYLGYNELYIADEIVSDMVEKAILSKQGVRYLKRAIDKYCIDIEFNPLPAQKLLETEV